MHDSVEVWDAPRVTLAGVSVHVRPVEGEDDEARLTVPVKLLTGAIVIVEVVGLPALALAEVGLADTLKSWRLTMMVAERASDPLVPVTVTVYTPELPEQVKVEVCETPSVMLV